MRRILILFLLFIPIILANAQDSKNEVIEQENNSQILEKEEDPNTKIFPVPVINNRFNITSDKAFTFIRLTNIIGQEITRIKYNTPRNRSEISFADAQKGIYLVLIEYEDKTKTVKKILIDSQR